MVSWTSSSSNGCAPSSVEYQRSIEELGGSLGRKRVKRIKYEKRSVVWMRGFKTELAGKEYSSRHATKEKILARHATGILYGTGGQSSSIKNQTRLRIQASALDFVGMF
ncbi:hypothetical protein HanXRQr2_Chr03g0101241 [Helianthus annuus]|uniref:Uncharacterized protein n=1 Tax=Helianthus annuus TaxID=4232 RepID=A0A9K3JEU1_HELAN|nr:hypothetical protein HanXRQr2_Chr03g0101241 [Helianthus annuus]KAJ0942886.1 hypothetical protein HanPSC8_Chr03g0097541 [Helianthus annuus]